MVDETETILNNIEELEAQLEAEKLKLALEQAEDEAEEQALLLAIAAENALKAEKEAALLAIQKEVDRKIALQVRIDALKDLKGSFHSVYQDIPNSAIFFKELLDKAPTSAGKIMKALEDKDSELALLKDAEDIITNRKSEYKSIEEVIHIILDHGINSQAMIELQEERAAIKAKFPKEI